MYILYVNGIFVITIIVTFIRRVIIYYEILFFRCLVTIYLFILYIRMYK